MSSPTQTLTNSNATSSTSDSKPGELSPRSLFDRLVIAIRAAFAPGGFAWGLAVGVALAVSVFFLPNSSVDQSLREKATIFDLILRDISSSYVEQIDIDKLFETGVNQMLATLDPYTQFENNAEALEMALRTSGRYAGVGLGISATEPSRTSIAPIKLPTPNKANNVGDNEKSKENDASSSRQITVISAFEGYAFDEGVRPGDIIETVDDKTVSGLSLEQVTDLLRGEPGTRVSINVRREGRPEPLTFVLERRQINIRNVPVSTLIGGPGIGYIRLESFAKGAASEVRSSIKELIAEAEAASPGQGLRGLVLDLRGNPGGLLNAAVEVSECIVPRDSVIVSTSGRGIGDGPTYKSKNDPILPAGTRLAVLVNGQTASASEIVAGAVQDLDLGVVVGSKTFGKGLVQNVQELPYQTALKYTVGKYLTPSGRCIQALDYHQGNANDAEETKGEITEKAKIRRTFGSTYDAREIPDGQRKEFRTANGRRVRDGGGIEPDIAISKQTTFLEAALVRQNMFFKYANRYAADRDLETLPDSFTVTDPIFRDFMKFVTTTKFKYQSQFDEAFDELDMMLESVGYDSARGRVADLKRATEQEMREDFVRHEAELKRRLESAIRFRLQPDSVRIKAELQTDNQLSEAVRILQNRHDYYALLSPPQVPQAMADASQSQPMNKAS